MPLAWDDFRLVKTIADRGGLAQAAVELGINHSTAFRRLGAIEAGIETRLFDRLRSGYVPTPAGEAMIAAAVRMEADATRFGREVAGAAPAPAGRLRITAPAGLTADLLMPLFARFRQAYPALQLDLVLAEEVLNLSRQDADVALRASDDPPPTLVGRRLGSIAWAIYGRAGQRPGALSDSDWVTPAETVAGGRFMRFVLEQAAPERIALRCNTVLGLREAIEAGLGIGPLPCMVGDLAPGLARLAAPEPELGGSLWLLTHPDLRHSARVRAFMDFMGEALAPMRPAFEGRRRAPT